MCRSDGRLPPQLKGPPVAKRYDISVPRKGRNDKTYWTKIGTAWENDRGQIQLVFDALPLPDADGRCVANLFEPREDQGRSASRDQADARERSGGQGGYGRQQSQDYDDGSDIPF